MGEEQYWFNKPVTTSLLGWGEYRKGATGVEKGVEKFASGLLSPLSIGLMAVTAGVGGVAAAGAEVAGEDVATGLAGASGRALLSKLAPETAIAVGKAAGVVSKLANAGFTGQQIVGVMQKLPQFADAVRAGDTDKALELGTQSLLEGTLAGLSTRHLMKSINPSGEPVWTDDKEVIDAHQQAQREWSAKAGAWRTANEALIKNRPLDMAARFYHWAGGDTTKLEQWRQDIVDNNNIRPEIQRKYDAILEQAQKLPPELQKLSSQLTLEYSQHLARLKQAGIFHDNFKGQDNYGGQLKYDLEDEGGSSMRQPGLRDRSGFVKKRSFENVMEALKAGFEPKDIGLAGAYEEYLQGMGDQLGKYEAEKMIRSQRAEDNRPQGVYGSKTIDGKDVIPVDKGSDIGDIAERRADAETRQRIDAMTPDEREQAIRDLRQTGPTLKPSAFRMAEEEHRPEDFMRRALGGGEITDQHLKAAVVGEGVSDLEVQNLREAYEKGAKVEPVQVTVDKDGGVVGYSGLHRAYAALLAGVEKIPVERRTLKEVRPTSADPAPGKWPSGLDPVTDKQILAHAIAEITGTGTHGFDDVDPATGKKLFGPNARKLILQRALEMKTEQKTASSESPTATRKPTLKPAGSKIIVKDGKLYWDVSDYKEGPKAFRRFRYDGTDEKGDPRFKMETMRLHPETHDAITQAFSDDSWFRKNPILGPALKGSSQAKKSLLTLSPFHWNTEYLRGIQMGLSPMEALRPKDVTPERVAAWTKNGKFAPNFSLQNQRSLVAEGVGENSSLIHKIPGIGKFLASAEEKLFGGNGYIDRLKADSFDKVTSQLSRRHPNWTQDQVQFSSSKIVDAAFGGLNWKMLGTSTNGVDALRLIFLAPDFTGSQVLFAKYGLQPGGSVVGQSLARIALYNFGVARVLNMLTTGKPHMEHPFSVVSPDEKKTYSIRTMPQDILHALTDPRGFTYNRLNPLLVRTAVEGVTGRDETGKRVTYEKELHDMLRNVLPISGQNIIPGFRREDEGIGTSVLRGLGVAAEANTTSAYKLAGQLASDRSESGPVDQDKLDRHRYVMQMEDSLRSGALRGQDINDAIRHDQLSQDEAKQIYENYKATRQGVDGKPMGEYTARLYTRANRLPVKDLLQVYDIATSQEKKLLLPLVEKKGKAYLKKAQTSTVKSDRDKDPTYNRLWRDLQHMPLW